MIDITPIELRVALAVLAIAVLVIVAKMSRAKPKRAEKWEKAAIMRQLLALSDQEETRQAAAAAAAAERQRAQSARAARPSPTRVKAARRPAWPSVGARAGTATALPAEDQHRPSVVDGGQP